MSESIKFLGFSSVVLLAYYAIRSAGWRRAVLLLSNLLFLAIFYQGVRAYVPLAAFLIFGYAGLQLIHWRPQRTFVPVLLVTIATFIWLKKYAFLPSSTFLHFVYVTVGLSYILFRVLHLMIDTHTGALQDRIGFVSFFNYTTNFTTLVSGPIQQYQDYRASEDPAQRRRLTRMDVWQAIERITRGVFKTDVLALLLSTLQSRMVEAVTTAHLTRVQLPSAVMMFVLYPFFIYCNFSGYIDIVIGVGRLLGVVLPENFARPFAADNIIDYWSNRWHITLSGWLRTYVYNPLLVGLMRRFPSAGMESVWAVLAFFVTFFLVGVWHGQTSEFLFYGCLLGLGVSVNKIYQIVMLRKMGRKPYAKLTTNPLYVAVARGFTFTWVAFTLTWFWSNWQQMRVLEATLGPGLLAVTWMIILVGSTILLALWEKAYVRGMAAPWNDVPLFSQCLRTAWSTALIVITVAVIFLMNQPAPEIVYKAF